MNLRTNEQAEMESVCILKNLVIECLEKTTAA